MLPLRWAKISTSPDGFPNTSDLLGKLKESITTVQHLTLLYILACQEHLHVKERLKYESCSCYSSRSWSRRRLHFRLRLQEFPNRPSVSAIEHIPPSTMAWKKWKLMLKSSFLTNPNILPKQRIFPQKIVTLISSRIRVNNRIEEQICTIWLPCNSWYLLPIILDSINPLLFIKPLFILILHISSFKLLSKLIIH